MSMQRQCGQQAKWFSLFPIGWQLFLRPIKTSEDIERTAPDGYSFLFRHFRQCLRSFLSLLPKRSLILRQPFSRSLQPFRHCSKGLLTYFCIHLDISCTFFSFLFIKIRNLGHHIKIYNNIRGSSPIYALSNHVALSKTPTDTMVFNLGCGKVPCG